MCGFQAGDDTRQGRACDTELSAARIRMDTHLASSWAVDVGTEHRVQPSDDSVELIASISVPGPIAAYNKGPPVREYGKSIAVNLALPIIQRFSFDLNLRSSDPT